MVMPPDSRRAICSLEPTRLATSPAWRCVKNSNGSIIKRQRNRLVVTTASLACSRSRTDWRTTTNTARHVAISAIPIRSGASQLSMRWMRMSSTNILEKPAAIILGITRTMLTITSSATADLLRRSSRRSRPIPFGLAPSSLNSSPRSKVNTTPVKARSSSAMLTRRRPVAGSLM